MRFYGGISQSSLIRNFIMGIPYPPCFFGWGADEYGRIVELIELFRLTSVY